MPTRSGEVAQPTTGSCSLETGLGDLLPKLLMVGETHGSLLMNPIALSIHPASLQVRQEQWLQIRLTNRSSLACQHICIQLRRPSALSLLEGTEVAEFARLEPNETASVDILVMPQRVGSYRLMTRIFSFIDGHGQPWLPEPSQLSLQVIEGGGEQDLRSPESVDLQVVPGHLKQDAWQTITVHVDNRTADPLHQLQVQAFGADLDAKNAPPWQAVSPHSTTTLRLQVCPRAHGPSVPITLLANYRTPSGRSHQRRRDITMQVFPTVPSRPSHPSTGHATPATLQTILFTAADPTDAGRLRTGNEFKEIRNWLRQSAERDAFALQMTTATRVSDLTQALHDYKPAIVHFSGHGDADGRLAFEQDSGASLLVEAEVLGALFAEFSATLHCIVLNACYSAREAAAIARAIPYVYVVGLAHAVRDDAATAYSRGFYQALGAGRTVPEAHRFGCHHVHADFGKAMQVPKLITTSTESMQPTTVVE